MTLDQPTILLVGFDADVARVAGMLDGDRVASVHAGQDARPSDLPSRADVTAYLISSDTPWSSRLYSLFTYINSTVEHGVEYFVSVDGTEMPPGIFPSMPRCPTMEAGLLEEKSLELARRSPG